MNEKTPLIRLAKREDMSKSKVWLIRAAAFLLAIVLGGLVFFIRLERMNELPFKFRQNGLFQYIINRAQTEE